MTTGIVEYTPNGGMYTGGNVVFLWVDAIANVNAPKLTELNTGVTFQCANDKLGVSIDVKMETERFPCDVEEREEIGNIKRGLEDMRIQVDDPQKPGIIFSKMVTGKVGYIVTRYGLPTNPTMTPFAAGQIVSVHKVRVAASFYDTIGTEGGAKFWKQFKFAYLDGADDVAIVA